MKKLYSLLLVFLLSFGASAQVFATLGAEWHYTNLESGWMPNRGYEKVTAVGDTVIQGKVCRKLERTLVTTYSSTVQSLPDEFLHINGDTVFLLQADSLFHVLYNFAAQPGDSWIILGRTSWGDPTLGDVVVTVDSISVTSINGHQLRQLHVSTTTSLTSFGHPSTITEKLGGANYMFPVDYGFSDSFIRIGLRCYSDPNFGNYQSNPSIGCTQLITTSAPENNPLFPQKLTPILLQVW